MSRIIKNADLVLSYPRIINSPELVIVEKDNEEEIAPVIEAPVISQLDQEKEELQELKRESQKILLETEQIVMDLLEKARGEAKNIMNIAQEEADVLKSQIFEEAKALRKEASTQGYHDGLKQAQAEIEADRQMALEQSRQIIEEARNTKLDMFNSAETDIIRLVLAISKKIIASELLVNHHAIVNIVRQAIANLDSPDNVRIYVNPENLQVLLDAIEIEGLNEIGSRDIGIEVKADKRVSSGGCIIDSDSGSVDAQLETRIEKVETAILEAVNE